MFHGMPGGMHGDFMAYRSESSAFGGNEFGIPVENFFAAVSYVNEDLPMFQVP